MTIGTKKIVTYKVDEERAKRFYNRIMSEDKPIVRLKQLLELRQTFVFTNLSINYERDTKRVNAIIDGKRVSVLFD